MTGQHPNQADKEIAWGLLSAIIFGLPLAFILHATVGTGALVSTLVVTVCLIGGLAAGWHHHRPR